MKNSKIGLLILLYTVLVSCQGPQPSEQDVVQEVTPEDSIGEGNLVGKTVEIDTLKMEEAAVPYVSLLAQRDQIANQALIARLIEEGAKDVQYVNSNTVLSSLNPKPPVAYDKVSFFAYLEDLLRFEQYEKDGIDLGQVNDDNKMPWPAYLGLREPDHKVLAYPLVRKEYLSEHCPGCLNPNYLTGNTKKLDPTQISHPRYQPLLEIYTRIFDPQLRQALYKDYIAFAYEELSASASRADAQYRATATLAYQFNQQAQEEVRSRQAQQESQLQKNFSRLKRSWKSKDERATLKYLNEILKLQEELLEPLPIQNDILAFFANENNGNPFPAAIKAKAGQLKKYYPLAISSDEGVLSGAAMSFAQKALQAKPLGPEDVQKISSSLENTQRRLATYTTALDGIKRQLAAHAAVFNEEERSFFNAYLLSFQYHINVWKRFELQLEELLEVPSSESSFSYLLLLDHAIKERDKAIENNPLIATAHNKLRKLRGMYYQELREKEAFFRPSKEDS